MKLKYREEVVSRIQEEIEKKEFVNKCRMTAKDFTRNRKVTPLDLINYELNKKGLSSKMEIKKFNEIKDVDNITASGFFQQREKLNPEAFTYLTQMSVRTFYTDFPNEVKKFKGYVLTAVDGSDFEIPNTEKARKQFNGNQQEQCARVTVSTYYDVLNKYTLDTIVEKYDFSEIEMAKRHIETVEKEKLLGDFKSIHIGDRNYKSIADFYYFIKTNQKFVIRVAESSYKKEKDAMTSKDEIIELGYEYNRIKYYKDTDPEVYNYFKNGGTIKVRCVKIELNTGETEFLFTNLEIDEFTTEDINEIYQLRWKIEINYKHLKSNMKIECITSSKELLIKQDIYSQILVANLLQSFINDSDEKLQELKYKHEVKTNKNMAIGLFKDKLINIFLENDGHRRATMMNELVDEMSKYLVYVIPRRKNERKCNPKNKYHLNQRKSF